MSLYGHAMMKPTVVVGTTAWLATFAAPSCDANPDANPNTKPNDIVLPLLPVRKARPKAKTQAKKKPAGSAPTMQHHAYQVTFNKKGKKQVTGKRDELKGSQIYPVRFALAIVKSHWANIASA